MKVYYNPNIFKSISTNGLDFTAKLTPTIFNRDSTSCYVNSSITSTIQIFQCQAYNDYVYNQQFDNIHKITANYGLFDFTCGNGVKVVCPSGQSCA